MAKTYPCPIEVCDHAPFKTVQALQSHIRSSQPEVLEEKGPAKEVPMLSMTSPLLNWLGSRHIDIEKAPSY